MNELLIGNNPNPLSENTIIYYKIVNPSLTTEATIELYNSIGLLIWRFAVDPEKGSLNLDSLSLAEGIYFYTLIINDDHVGTKKMYVRR